MHSNDNQGLSTIKSRADVISVSNRSDCIDTWLYGLTTAASNEGFLDVGFRSSMSVWQHTVIGHEIMDFRDFSALFNVVWWLKLKFNLSAAAS